MRKRANVDGLSATCRAAKKPNPKWKRSRIMFEEGYTASVAV